MKVEVIPPTGPNEYVLRLTEAEALTIRRALYVAGVVADKDGRWNTSTPTWAPLKDALDLYGKLANYVGG